MDIRKVKKLIELMEESNIGEIEIREAEESVRISRMPQTAGVMPAAAMPESTTAPAPVPPVVTAGTKNGHVLRAPMVGTFYIAPSPGSPAFMEVGGRVKAGDVVCIIESMKMMNQVKSDRSGVIEAILVANEQAVEFDQPLFTIV